VLSFIIFACFGMEACASIPKFSNWDSFGNVTVKLGMMREG